MIVFYKMLCSECLHTNKKADKLDLPIASCIVDVWQFKLFILCALLSLLFKMHFYFQINVSIYA